MAIKQISLGSKSSNTNDLLEKLALQYGKQATPKVGTFRRIMAPLTGIGSIIDAYHDARYEDKNASVGNVLKNYGINLGRGLGTLFTGTDYENIEGASELLDKMNPNYKYSGLGKSTLGRMGVDILAGLVTDPTTYLSFGATSLADDAIKGGLKAAGLGDDIITKVLPKVAGGTVDDVSKVVAKELGTDVADLFYRNIVNELGRGTAKSGAMKFMGKTITESPTVVKGSKALIEPLSGIMEGADWASKKFTPKMRANMLDIFDPVQGAVEAGKGSVGDLMLSTNRKLASKGLRAEGAMQEAGIIDAINKLAPDQQKAFVDILEQTKGATEKNAEIAKLLGANENAISKYISSLTDTGTGLIPEEIFKETPMDEVESVLRGTADKNIFGRGGLPRPDMGAPELTDVEWDDLFDDAGNVADDVNINDLFKPDMAEQTQLQSMSVLKDAERTAREDLVRAVGEDAADSLDYRLIEKGFGSEGFNADTFLKEAFGTGGGKRPLVFPEGTTDDMKDAISKYVDFEDLSSKKMKELGLPTLPIEERGYLSRTIKGFNKKGVKSTLGSEGISKDRITEILNNKRVAKEIEKNGYVTKDTLNKVLTEGENNLMKKYTTGDIGTEIFGGGSVLERKFPTREAGRKAGIVYEDEQPLIEILKQTKRQEGQIIAKEAADKMATLEDVDGNKIFESTPVRGLTTPVNLPGTGTLYTDAHTAKIAEEYVRKYSDVNGMEELLKPLDKAMIFWKGAVTAKGPNVFTYNARNALDDNIRMLLSGTSPSDMKTGYLISKDLFDYEDLVNRVGREEAMKTFDTSRIDKFYKELGLDVKNSADDLWNKVLDNGVYADTGKTMSEAGIDISPQLRKKLGLKRTADDLLTEAATAGGRTVQREQASRITQFLSGWKKTGSVQEGVEATKRVLFNYNELSKVEKDVFKRAVPFYSFVKNNLKFYLDTLKDNPEKIGRFMNVYDGLESGSQSKYQEEFDAMPDYMKKGLTIPIGIKDGELKSIGGLRSSIEALDALPVTESGLKEAAGDMNPILNILMERVSGKDLFRDQDILDVNQAQSYENMPQLFKDLVGYNKYDVKLDSGKTYSKQTMSPEARYWLESIPILSQFTQASKKTADLTSGKDMGEQLTKIFLPATIYKQGVDEAASNIERNKEQALYELLRKKGIAETYNRFYIPKGLKDQLNK